MNPGNAVKTKAYVLLFAWLLIFAHGVVPHHHFENIGCHELFHSEKTSLHDDDLSVRFRSSMSDVNVCHASGLLYHQSHDTNFLFHSIKDEAGRVSIESEHYFPASDQTISYCCFGQSVQLRAPPAA